MSAIYLDHNATTKPHPDVQTAMLSCLAEHFGNPASMHSFGQKAKRLLEKARVQVAQTLNAPATALHFTSGGSEANTQALLKAAQSIRQQHPEKTKIIASQMEHSSVLESLKALEKEGFTLLYLPVDPLGYVQTAEFQQLLQDPEVANQSALLTIMLANNDIGSIQPLKELTAVAHAHGLYVHTDAVQAYGKIPVDVQELAVDFLSLSAHKIYGPKGVGALYVKPASAKLLTPLIYGGQQEQALRAGTENLPGIVGLGTAAKFIADPVYFKTLNDHLSSLKQELATSILTSIPGSQVNGELSTRTLSNTLNIDFSQALQIANARRRGSPSSTPENGTALLIELDLRDIAVARGSACSNLNAAPSNTLLAMGLSRERIEASLRFSLGRENTFKEIRQTVESLQQILGS